MFESQLGHITIAEIDNEIISTVIRPLPLIKEGQLSITVDSDFPPFVTRDYQEQIISFQSRPFFKKGQENV